MQSVFRGGHSLPIESKVTGALRCRLVLAVGNRGFGRGKADFAVGAVTEGFVGGAAAPAQHERTLGNRVRISVPVDQRYIVAFHEVRTVLSDLDIRHTPSCWSQFHVMRARP